MHIHIGILDAIVTFLYIIIIGFFWRLASYYFADRDIGKAMAFIY